MPVAFEHQDSMSAAQWRTGPTRKQRSGRCGAPRSHINADSSCSRSSSSSSEEAHAPPRKQKQGRKVMRMVGGWLARSRSSRGKRSATFHSLGEPMVLDTKKVLTPATPQTHLSTVTTDQDTETEEESGPGHRKRVSFDLDVTTVIIAQMDKEDLENTFYTRREFGAFKDAYRTHRDTPEWTRENDGLPCNCTSCSDDGTGSSAGYANYPPPESPPVSPPSSLLLYSDADDAQEFSVWDSPREGEVSQIQASEGDFAPPLDEPPSPVGATFGDSDDTSLGSSVERETGLDAVISRTQSRSTTRKVSWESEGVSPNVVHAVEKYGEEYAYKRLRLQGFSDQYIRSHFFAGNT